MKRFALILAVLFVGGATLAVAEDINDLLARLKDAEAKKDAAVVKKLAGEIVTQAKVIEAESAPVDDVEGWKGRVGGAQSAELYTEYALYTTAIQSPPATLIDLIVTLEEQNPKSKYLDEAYVPYFVALKKTGASAQIPAVAEKALANFPDNVDLLLVMEEHASSRKQFDQALRYDQRVISVLTARPKPGKSASLGYAYYKAGVIHMQNAKFYADANRELRAALPLIKSDQTMTHTALFNLGIANYQLGKLTLNKAQVLEGVKFSEQAAALPGPYQRDAWRNANVMKTEAIKMR